MAAFFALGSLLGGDVITSNVVKETVAVSAKVINESIVKLGTRVSMSNNINIDCVINGNLNINQEIDMSISASALNQAMNSTTTQQAIQEEITQLAKAVSQTLNLNPGSTEAHNVTNAVTKLSSVIINQTMTVCQKTIISSNNITVGGGKKCSLTGNFNWNQRSFMSSYTNCVQNAVNSSNAGQQLKLAISQTAAAKQANSFAIFAMVLGVIAVAFVFSGKSVMKATSRWQFWAGVGPLSYLGIAYATNLWPYPRPTVASVKCNNDTDCGDGNKCYKGECATLCDGVSDCPNANYACTATGDADGSSVCVAPQGAQCNAGDTCPDGSSCPSSGLCAPPS